MSVRRLQLRLLPGFLILLSAAACAPRGRTARIPSAPPADGLSAEGELEGVLFASRTRAASGEGLLDRGQLAEAQAEFREAIVLLESYLGRTPESSDRLRGEIDNLRMRLDSLGSARFEPATASIVPGPDREADPFGLRLDLNEQVSARLAYFTEGAGRSTIEIGLDRAELFRPMVRRIFEEEGVPQSLIHLAQAESAFKPEAVSRSAARGMWQFIPERGEEYGLRQNWWIDERSDPEKSTRAAARHLRDLYDQFGDWYLAMAAYNAGPGRVSRAISEAGSWDFWVLSERGLLPPETRTYVPTVIAMAIIGLNPGAYGFDPQPTDMAETTRVPVARATDLRVIAERLDMPLEDLQGLNPHVMRWATPPDDPEFELILPADLANRFLVEVDSLPEEARILFRHHLVASGETLSHIARLHGVPIALIADANRMANPDALRTGQSLIIPISGVTAPDTPMPGLSSAPLTPPERYSIQPGDTLSEIALRFGLEVADIRRWNGMDSNILIAGGILRLTPDAVAIGARPPTPESASEFTHGVRPGDTLSSIARTYGTSVDALLAWNLETDLSVIHPGDEITIRRPGTPEVE